MCSAVSVVIVYALWRLKLLRFSEVAECWLWASIYFIAFLRSRVRPRSAFQQETEFQRATYPAMNNKIDSHCKTQWFNPNRTHQKPKSRSQSLKASIILWSCATDVWSKCWSNSAPAFKSALRSTNYSLLLFGLLKKRKRKKEKRMESLLLSETWFQ